MMGYGARDGVAQSQHDPLYARAVYLESGEARLLWIQCDLCLMSPTQAAGLRERVAERTGLAPGCVLVGCIHTHSGPETGLLEQLLGRPAPGHVRPLFDAIVEAGARVPPSAATAGVPVDRSTATC
jgi:hypothetical protein